MRFPFETIFPYAPRPSRRDLPFRAVASLYPTVSHHDKRWIRTLHARPATSHASRHAPCNPALFTLEVYDSTPFRAPILRVATSCPIHFTSRSLQSRVVHVATLRPSFVTYINASQRALNHCGTPIAECAAIFGQINRIAGCQSINRKVARRFFLGKCQAVTMQARPSGPVRPNPDADLPKNPGRPEKLSKNQGLTRSCTLHTANSAGKTSFICLPNAGGE